MVQTCNSADTAHRILRDFGLVIPPEQDGLATARGGLDLIIFPDEPMEGGELAGLPVNRSLDLAREGWAINLGGGDLAAALSF